jgi:4-hydroxyphenylacetate 3-monooxygenase
MATSEFDNPLSFRFDENDAVAHFDNVRIPHDRVFLKRNLAAAAAQWHDTRAHVYQNYQSLVRLTVKLRFLLGMAHRIAEVNGTLGLPQMRDTLGALAAKVSLMDAALAGMEAAGEPYQGCFVPNRSMLCAGQAAAQRLYPEMMHTLRELAGGGLIMLPSSAQDLMHLASRSLVERTQHSPAASPLERVKFFKLVWDAVGSEFGSRHLQYEMFYSGAPFVINAHNYRFYDWQGAVGMVSDFMGSYGTPPIMAPATTPAGG